MDYWNTLGPGAIGKLFGGGGGRNPARDANKYFERIPGVLHENFDPYIQRGNRAGGMLEDEYGSLMHDPGARLNEIGGGYQQSPGFQFALQQALQGSGNAAAAGGMAGSPQHQFQNMDIATGLANRDYNDWITRALGLYGAGLGGEQGFYDTGAKAGMGLGENLASNLAQQGQYAYAGRAGQNAAKSRGFQNFLQGAGTLAAFL